jgi:hypothetical protein
MPQWEYLIVIFDQDQDRPRYTRITPVDPQQVPPDTSRGEEIPHWQTRNRLDLYNEWSAQGWRLVGGIPPPAPGRQLHYRRWQA